MTKPNVPSITSGSLDANHMVQLRPPVRRLLQDAEATVTAGLFSALTGGFSGSAVHRFHGLAHTTQGERAWSLIRKEFHVDNGSPEVTAYDYWLREVQLYQSGLLATLPPALVAPQCFGIEELADGGYALWLEDMGEQPLTEQWPLAYYGIAAYHLGQMNGLYLTEHPLPTFSWLRGPDVRDRLQAAAPGIDQLPTLQTNPHFAPLLPNDHVDRIQRLWAEHESLLTRLDQLPQSFCHRDAFQRNLLMRHDAEHPTTVALDWGSCGIGMLGEELVPLFAATLRFVVADTGRLAELDETIFAGYVAGLRDAGWQGDERLVRFGFTALAGLKMAVASPATKLPNVARRIAALPPGVEPPKLLNPGGYEQAVLVKGYELGLGEEACALAQALW